MMDNNCYELVLKNIRQSRTPYEQQRFPFYVVIETHHNGSQEETNDKIISFVGDSLEKFANVSRV